MREGRTAVKGRPPAGSRDRSYGARPIAMLVALLLGSVSAVTLLPAVPATAANNGQFSISPVQAKSFQRTYFTPIVQPGVPSTDTVVIGNETHAPLTLHVYASDAFTTRAGGFVLQPDYKPKKAMGAWIHLPVSRITIPPLNGDVVKFTYNPPANVPPGDYNGGIVAEETKGPVNRRGTVRVQSLYAVGVAVFGRVSGPLHPRLAVTKVAVHATRPLASQFGGPVKATVTYSVTNTGNQNLTPNIAVSLSPLIGSAKTAHSKVSLLLPGSTVTLHKTFDSTLPFGHLSANVVAGSVGASSSGGGGTVVVPWGLVVIVVALLFLLLYRRHRKNKAKGEEADEDQPQDPPVEAAAGSGPPGTTA